MTVGCGGSSGNGSGTATTSTLPSAGSGTPLLTGGASSIYLAQLPVDGTAASILQFSATVNGASGPISTLTTPLGFQLTAVATDASGQIYAGGYMFSTVVGQVLVYAPGASGAATPLRTITGIGGNFYGPQSMTVDSSGNLYLLNGAGSQTVSVYGPTSQGAAVPIRQISGALTKITLNPFGIAVDRAGTVYVANKNNIGTGQILAFAPLATGNVAPVRLIAGSAATLDYLYAMDTDAAGNLYVASFNPSTDAAILKFAPTADGNVAPLNTITGAKTGLVEVEGLRVDAVGNIYAAGKTLTFTGLPPALQAFPPTATGNVAPAFTLASTSWIGPGYYFQLALK